MGYETSLFNHWFWFSAVFFLALKLYHCLIFHEGHQEVGENMDCLLKSFATYSQISLRSPRLSIFVQM